jgi:cyclophilin family peptidyl-prolyl cis-trans isomerase
VLACVLSVVAMRPVVGKTEATVVRIVTSSGSFTVELYPDRAPVTVRRFLDGAARHEGLVLCESRAHGFLVFGCSAGMPPPGVKPASPPEDSPLPDEIDAEAMGLSGRIIEGNPERDRLWQQEILPRARSLEDAGRPVPDGLRSLVQSVRRDGTAAFSRLDGMTRKRYLEILGYRFVPGGSPYPVVRGVIATANVWPGEADGRFLVALDDLPDRDGRATVFGRVVDGWGTLETIARIPVDKGHRPREPVTLLSVERLR